MLAFKHPAPAIELVSVAAGTFSMGHMDGHDDSGRESPTHDVTLSSYAIGRFPVTNAQYALFIDDTGFAPPSTWKDGEPPYGRDDHPVGGLSWLDAALLCAWLRYKTGEPYHLPTEAQWERAATWDEASDAKRAYPWGDQRDTSLANTLDAGPKRTTPVGAYSPQGDSPCGCADMVGSAQEWCNTAMREYPYEADDGCESIAADGRRALRGGDWYSAMVTAVRRNTPGPEWRHLWGVRVASSDALAVAERGFRLRLAAWAADEEPSYLRATGQDPENPQAWYTYGMWLLEVCDAGIDRAADASRALSNALTREQSAARGVLGFRKPRLTATLAAVYHARARARLLQARRDDAFADALEAYKLEPANLEYALLRAQITCALERWPQLAQDLALLDGAALIDGSAEFALIEARFHSGVRDYAKALAVLNKLIGRSVVEPPPLEAFLLRGEVYDKLGRAAEALGDYCRFALLAPADQRSPDLLRRILTSQ